MEQQQLYLKITDDLCRKKTNSGQVSTVLLPAACCLLPAACCLLPAACCLLPADAPVAVAVADLITLGQSLHDHEKSTLLRRMSVSKLNNLVLP